MPFYPHYKYFTTSKPAKLVGIGFKLTDSIKNHKLPRLIPIPDNFKTVLCLILFACILAGCNETPKGIITRSDSVPKIEPDYTDITIPPNIAPMNFLIKEAGKEFYVRYHTGGSTLLEFFSGSGKIEIPQHEWSRFLRAVAGKSFNIDIYSKDKNGNWTMFKPITNRIAAEQIDPYMYYRLIYPGYESWSELSINIRELENFQTKPLIENSAADQNCINCHSFNNGISDDFLFHMRGSHGGTYFSRAGIFRKINLKTPEMKNAAVYARWHPSGKLVAFSSNKIIQRFHSADNKKIEVSDLESSLLLYDVEKNEIMNIGLAGSDTSMDTYPEWSPDGRYLYFCRAKQIGEKYDFKEIRYNLYRAAFDTTARSFGAPVCVYNAASEGKSVAFPRISPDGKHLIVTVAAYGIFPIWHKEADLYSIDTENSKIEKLGLNSDYCESYHSWSSNGKWLLFSSKRGDGLTARPYISYIGENGVSDKPFVLPQKDPEFYSEFLKSFNIPEFSKVKINMTPGEISRLAGTQAIQAKWHQK